MARNERVARDSPVHRLVRDGVADAGNPHRRRPRLLTLTLIIRLVALILGACVVSLSITACRHSVNLVHSQPDGSMGSRINKVAYAALGIAGAQAIAQQVALLHSGAPIRWYGAPIIIVWQGMLIIWFTRRVQWHMKTEQST